MKNQDLLDSWKEISSYLERDVRTCMRWEKELGLPVHRMDDSSSRAKVFAYRSEIDAWLEQRAKSRKNQILAFLDNKKNAAVTLAASIALCLCLAVLYIHKINSRSDSKISLAIMPFTNPSSPEYNPYLTTGIMNEIITMLMNTGKFMIIPITSPLQNEERSQKDKASNKEEASYIVRGGAQKDNNNIHIHIEMVRVKGGKQLFKDEFITRIDKLQSTQIKICQKICNILNLRYDKNQIQNLLNFPEFDIYSQKKNISEAFKEDPDNPLNLCLQGQSFLRYLSKESTEKASHLFQRALELDNGCARAYLGLAQCFANLINFAGENNPSWLDKAEDNAKKAQPLEPDLPEYFSTLIQIYLLQESERYENKKEMIKELADEGLKKHPRNAQLLSTVGYYYFALYGETGDPKHFSQALEMKDKAFLLDPFAPRNIAYTELLMLQQNYAKALEICRLLEKSDDSINTPYRLMQLYYYMGDLAASKSIYAQIREDSLALKLDHHFFLGMMAAQEGNQNETFKMINKIHLLGQDGVMKGFNLKMASIYMGLGMRAEGFQYLDTFFKKPYAYLRHYIYLKYIDIDKNFDNYKKEIFNRYKHRITS